MSSRRMIMLSSMLHAARLAAWGAYYAVTRRFYANDPALLVLLAASETLPTISGLAGAYLSEKKGYSSSLLVGVAEGLLLALSGAYLADKHLLPLLVFAASLAWSISGPQLLGYVMEYSGGSAQRLGVVMAAGTLGFSAGSAAAPVVDEHLWPGAVLEALGILLALVSLLASLLAPGIRPSIGSYTGRLDRNLLALVMVMASLFLAGAELVSSIYMAKLSRESGSPLAYSLALGLAGIMGAAVRPIAGRIVDQKGDRLVLATSLILYILYVNGLNYLHGAYFIALWLLPLYPFADISMYKLAASLLGDAWGAAAISSSFSIAGSILLVIRVYRLYSNTSLAASTLFAAALAILLAIYWYRERRGLHGPAASLNNI